MEQNPSLSLSAGCPHCGADVCQVDRHCGACGKPLVVVHWRGPDGNYHTADGKLAVRPGMEAVTLELVNTGTVIAHLVPRDEAFQHLPRWIDRDRLQDLSHDLPPKARAPLTIPLVASHMTRLFEHAQAREEEQCEARLEFLTSRFHREGERWGPHPFVITLVVALEPRIAPARSRYRFIPRQRLGKPGLTHTVKIINEAAEPIVVTEVQPVDGDTPGPHHDSTLVPARALLHLPQKSKTGDIEIPPGKPFKLDMEMYLPDGALEEGKLGRVDAQIEVAFHIKGKPAKKETLVSVVEGFIGDGPTLEAAEQEGDQKLDDLQFGASLEVHLPPGQVKYNPRDLVLRNPGSVPVLVTRIEQLRQDGKPVASPRSDWVKVLELSQGALVSPGGYHSFHLSFHSGDRPDDELDEDVSVRLLRIHHDGWQDKEEERVIELEVRVPFGPVVHSDVIFLGVDFGTSNSMVCMILNDEDGEVPQILPLNLDKDTRTSPATPRAQLASMMFYDSQGLYTDSRQEGFLLGEKARNTAETAPANLVRSIKSVVVRNPSQIYSFEDRQQGGKIRWKEFRSQHLLNTFITALRIRAEGSIPDLDASTLQQIGLSEASVRFQRAVFTHPTEVGMEMKQALLEASHTARLNKEVGEQDIKNGGDSERMFCFIDEASAAVLAYVHDRVYHILELDPPPWENGKPWDEERVVCFDMGGGTTDMAVVHVRNLVSFMEPGSDATRIEVELLATAGDRDFGGDNLDLWIGRRILEAIAQQAEQQKAPIDKKGIADAMACRSLSEFRQLLRVRADVGGGDEKVEERVYPLYTKAQQLLLQAEQAKKELTTAERVTLSIGNADWPRTRQPKEEVKDNFEVELRREDYEQHVRQETRRRFISSGRVLGAQPLLDALILSAGWTWDSVTTLLFTGQASRVPFVREEILNHITSQREDGAPPPIIIEPDGPHNFDPKLCVAQGAAIWGLSQHEGYISVSSKADERLTFTPQYKKGPKFEKITGLENGTSLPAEATMTFPTERTSCTLFKNRKVYVRFNRFPPTTEVLVRVLGPADFRVVVDDKEYRGALVQ